MQQTYWAHSGKHQQLVFQLNKLVPAEGPVPEARKNRALEKFRKASNCYYDLYNNGLCNRAAEFRAVFGFGARPYMITYGARRGRFVEDLYERVERAIDIIVEDAAREQGLTG